jgi:methionine-rich copper-binding protein CopC
MAMACPAVASSVPFIAVLVTPPPAWELVSSPLPNQTLESPPQSVSITFSRVLRPDTSSLKIYDPYNNPLPVRDLSINGATMSVAMPRLESAYTGTYRVEWKAACVCANIPEKTDSFYFNIQ